MLPLFPHEDTERARQVVERVKPLADVFWQGHDPERFKTQPFSVLIVAMLSPRTQTQNSRAAMEALFQFAETPQQMLTLPYEQIHDILLTHDIRFPEAKAQHILETSQMLIDHYQGEVPRSLEALMRLPGMGWKTSLLTLLLAFGAAPEICVDVHVARISQRIGFVNPNTRQPQKVSRELMDIVPREHWKDWNPMFVYFGKNRCYPLQPACKGCPIFDLCDRVGVDYPEKSSA